MACENCELCTGEKCIAADLHPCDFAGENFKQECRRYQLYYLRPQVMQLR
ncbi:MAG: hypothetical protein IBX39_09865 [Candidatus Methanoperedenaceae archaeon]|nr:hypothetical protein [Candidatus Methanoperedenaceae archaeon]MDW7725755.1 hypothetical protein [Candidatus Methanoperedens sp.]